MHLAFVIGEKDGWEWRLQRDSTDSFSCKLYCSTSAEVCKAGLDLELVEDEGNAISYIERQQSTLLIMPAQPVIPTDFQSIARTKLITRHW